jgi:hypothetical protein
VNDDQTKSGTSAAVAVVVVMLVLAMVCALGLLFVGGMFFTRLQAPAAMPLPPVPGANAPLPAPTMPTQGSVTVNNLNSSQNLFDAADEVLTLAKYEQIRAGMTYEQLLSILAIPENYQPADIDLVGPESDVELKWFGGENDATSITVKLKGKTVVSKSQSGLK